MFIRLTLLTAILLLFSCKERPAQEMVDEVIKLEQSGKLKEAWELNNKLLAAVDETNSEHIESPFIHALAANIRAQQAFTTQGKEATFIEEAKRHIIMAEDSKNPDVLKLCGQAYFHLKLHKQAFKLYLDASKILKHQDIDTMKMAIYSELSMLGGNNTKGLAAYSRQSKTYGQIINPKIFKAQAEFQNFIASVNYFSPRPSGKLLNRIRLADYLAQDNALYLRNYAVILDTGLKSPNSAIKYYQLALKADPEKKVTNDRDRKLIQQRILKLKNPS